MSSRRYLKRIWRVPKHRGPVEYLATLIVKALVKHGWPAKWRVAQYDPWAFLILHDQAGMEHPPDFAAAVEIAVRIVSKTYRVSVNHDTGLVTLSVPYVVTAGGHFKEIKP